MEMPFDIVAFYESQTATALSAVAAVTDTIYKVTNTDYITVKKRAPYLGGIVAVGITRDTLDHAEIRQPSLSVPYRTHRVIDYDRDDSDRGLVNLFASPLPLYSEEKLSAWIKNATAEVSAIYLWLVSGRCTRAMQENVSPTHLISGYCDQTLTAGSWTTCTMTWDQDLPKGRYAVVGMDIKSYVTGGGNYPFGVARLILPETSWRVGVIAGQLWADKLGMTAKEINDFDSFRRFPLMPEISFPNDQLPDIEIMSGQARTDHVAELLLQKIA